MSGILSFIWILHLKQQNSVLCFYSLRFEIFYLGISFVVVPYILHSKRIVYTAGKVQIKYFVKTN